MPPPTSNGVFSCPAATWAMTNSSQPVIALYGYYAMRADLDRASACSVRFERQPDGQTRMVPAHSTTPDSECWRGTAANSTVPVTKLETAARTAQRRRRTRARRGVVHARTREPRRSITHLALAGVIEGDLAGAKPSSRRTEQRCDELDLPQGRIQPGLCTADRGLDAHRSPVNWSSAARTCPQAGTLTAISTASTRGRWSEPRSRPR